MLGTGCRTDASGVMSIASQGTVLAQARTRPFDVVTHENYVAPGKNHQADLRLARCY